MHGIGIERRGRGPHGDKRQAGAHPQKAHTGDIRDLSDKIPEFIFRVKRLRKLPEMLIHIGSIRNIIKIDREQFIFLTKLLQNIIGRTDYIIVHNICLIFHIHFFRGLIFFIQDLDAGFFLKRIDDGRIQIISVVKNNQRIIFVIAAPAKKKKNAVEAKPFTEAPRLKVKYTDEIVNQLKEKFGYENVMQIPKLEKVVINMGLGSEKDNPKGMESAVEELSIIAGQKPVVTKAKKSVANFKVREGMNIGAKVTLRGDRMYYFVDKLINIVLPRVRDFRGIPDTSFDGRGNYAMGLKEQLIFPEINYDDVDKIRGMDIVFVTTAKTDEEAKALLQMMGMPFMQA